MFSHTVSKSFLSFSLELNQAIFSGISGLPSWLESLSMLFSYQNMLISEPVRQNWNSCGAGGGGVGGGVCGSVVLQIWEAE